MNIVIFSGPPSSGKTSIILKTIDTLKQRNINIGVVKFDCLYTDDDVLYEKAGIPVKKGLSGALCPDHFFASNIEEVVQWGLKLGLDLLITESAGLCNRCSPYIKQIKGVCVIDNLSGINTPKKIGPMLKSADIVVITKGDIVSQAEREVFASKVSSVNPRAVTMNINGLTGQGAYELSTLLIDKEKDIDSVQGMELRFPMPAAMCSYCLGETRIGEAFQMGNVRKMDLGDDHIRELIEKYPFVASYFEDNKLDINGFEDYTFEEYLNHFSGEEIENWAIDKERLKEDLEAFIVQMKEFLGIKDEVGIQSLTIVSGHDKSKNPEGFREFTINKSEIVSIVGPTGSGKSRLLADIEWTAQNDTPTGRTILIDGKKPDMKWRYSSNNKLVAQLSQNMNFVMDLTVREFLELHAQSRLVEDVEATIDKIIIFYLAIICYLNYNCLYILKI
jgi:Ni2+-binding GTPase involved in maturation of urease and hydrogenase